jgi:hypothetical protein
MHGATIRPYVNAGVALVGAGVIAAAPVAAPAPPHVSLPTVRSAEVALTAAVNPLEAYGQLFNNTFQNIGLLTNQTFQNGIAPLLSQVLRNQQTLIQDLGQALEESLQISNPESIPAVLQRAVNQLANGQFQDAAETIATGITNVAVPFGLPLTVPLTNFTKVVGLLPTVVEVGGLALISPPLALVQATGQAIQDIADAFGTGDPTQVFNAVVDAPATMINGFLNGYEPTDFPGLLSQGLGGTLSTLVNIRDMIVEAITPTTSAATKTAATDEVTATKTKAAKVVTLDVAPATTDKATDSSAATDDAATDGTASDAKDADKDGTATDAKDDTSASSPASDETGSSTEATDTTKDTATKDTATKDGTDTKGDAKGDTATKGDTASKGDTTGKDDASSAKGSDSDKGSASTAKGDSTTKKASDSKKDSGTAKSTHKKAAKK